MSEPDRPAEFAVATVILVRPVRRGGLGQAALMWPCCWQLKQRVSPASGLPPVPRVFFCCAALWTAARWTAFTVDPALDFLDSHEYVLRMSERLQLQCRLEEDIASADVADDRATREAQICLLDKPDLESLASTRSISPVKSIRKLEMAELLAPSEIAGVSGSSSEWHSGFLTPDPHQFDGGSSE